jgi:hypothetical protein
VFFSLDETSLSAIFFGENSDLHHLALGGSGSPSRGGERGAVFCAANWHSSGERPHISAAEFGDTIARNAAHLRADSVAIVFRSAENAIAKMQVFLVHWQSARRTSPFSDAEGRGDSQLLQKRRPLQLHSRGAGPRLSRHRQVSFAFFLIFSFVFSFFLFWFRDIPGNAEVVHPGQNGLLFSDETDFLRVVDQVYEIDRSQISPLNTAKKEQQAYLSLLQNI